MLQKWYNQTTLSQYYLAKSFSGVRIFYFSILKTRILSKHQNIFYFADAYHLYGRVIILLNVILVNFLGKSHVWEFSVPSYWSNSLYNLI